MIKSKRPQKLFWQSLKSPFFALAPMDDVTDTVFRQIVARAAKPDVFFTEFTNVDGLMSKGRENVIGRLKFSKAEKPIIAQIWGLLPKNYYDASKMIAGMGFDGIDINMGCPQRDVVKIGACAGLMKDKEKAAQVIEAVKDGAKGLPVSVKTRLGYKFVEYEWLQFLLEQNLDALTVHGRTAAEMSKPPARWDEIGKVVEMRKKMGSKTVIIGNGDIANYHDGMDKHEKYGVDGLMIGRGIFENLWAFEKLSQSRIIDKKVRFDLLLEHVNLFEKTWGKVKNPQILKKFFKIYVNGFEGASELRAQLMLTKDYGQMRDTIFKQLRVTGLASSPASDSEHAP